MDKYIRKLDSESAKRQASIKSKFIEAANKMKAESKSFFLNFFFVVREIISNKLFVYCGKLIQLSFFCF